jgi:hypothetical protein
VFVLSSFVVLATGTPIAAWLALDYQIAAGAEWLFGAQAVGVAFAGVRTDTGKGELSDVYAERLDPRMQQLNRFLEALLSEPRETNQLLRQAAGHTGLSRPRRPDRARRLRLDGQPALRAHAWCKPYEEQDGMAPTPRGAANPGGDCREKCPRRSPGGTTEKRPRSRPGRLTPELADELLDRLRVRAGHRGSRSGRGGFAEYAVFVIAISSSRHFIRPRLDAGASGAARFRAR